MSTITSYKMQQNRQLLSEQFSSPLLLAVACEAGSCSVCFSFLVEIQRRERSEARDVAGGRRLFYRTSSARPVARFFFFCDSAFQREDGPKRVHLILGWGGGVGRIWSSESTLRAF